MIKQVSRTQDGTPVLAGVFALVGTHGIPLEAVLEQVKYRGLLVSWPHYVCEARKDGAKMKSIRARAFAAIGEVYGPQYLKGFQQRWGEWFND